MFDLVYVTHDSAIEGIGMSQIIPLLTRVSETNFRICLVTMEKSNYENSLNFKKAKHELESNGITWIRLNFGRTGPLGGAGRILKLTLRTPKAKVYHCRGEFPAYGLIFRRGALVWDVRGLWFEQKQFIGTAPGSVGFGKLISFLNSLVANKAQAITALSNNVLEVLSLRYDLEKKALAVIPTCTDLKKFQYSPFPRDQEAILLSGVFNDYYNLELTREFLSVFREFMDVKVIWAHGEEATRLSLNVGENERIVASSEEVPKLVSASLFGIAFCKFDAGVSLKGVVPTKVAEFLASGRPVVISSGLGDLDNLIESNSAGVVVRQDDNLRDIVRKVLDLLGDSETSRRCRHVAEMHFDINKAAKQYIGIYREIC